MMWALVVGDRHTSSMYIAPKGSLQVNLSLNALTESHKWL